MALALLFPGQGSQSVGMGADVAGASEAARAVFAAADAALGFSLSALCFEGPEEELVRTENQQPAILTTSIALLRALEEKGGPLSPAFVAGHSLGEYSALVAAGAVEFETAVRLVRERGRFMQEAVPEGRGAMAAVLGAAPDVVADTCRAVAEAGPGLVAPANFNSPQQTVIAGDAAEVEAACARLLESGAKRTVPLPVSAPFHCALMEPAASRLADELQKVEFRDAETPVVTNVEAAPNGSGERVADLLRRQVTAPVRFTETIERLATEGVDRFLEVGPGRVLSGLVARIQRRARRANLGTLEELDDAVAFAHED